MPKLTQKIVKMILFDTVFGTDLYNKKYPYFTVALCSNCQIISKALRCWLTIVHVHIPSVENSTYYRVDLLLYLHPSDFHFCTVFTLDFNVATSLTDMSLTILVPS